MPWALLLAILPSVLGAGGAHRSEALTPPGGAHGPHALTPPTATSPVVELPTYVVKDDRILPPPQRWDYARAPGLEILTDADLSQSEALATDFLRFHRAMAAVWPLERMNAAVPALLILCGDKKRARPFVPPDAPAGVDTYLSMSIQDHEMAAIVIDLDPELLAAGDSEDTGQVLRGEFIHLILARLGNLPPWVRQGLWTAFSSMRCANDEVGFPAAEADENLQARQKGDRAALAAAEKQGSFLPLATLVSAQTDSEVERMVPMRSGARPVWSRESYQFVHLCLLGDPADYRIPFLEYVLAAERAHANEALFRQFFHASYADFTYRLWHYTGFASPLVFKITRPGGGADPLPDLKFRRASDAQAGRIVGETLRLQGKLEAAHWELIAPYLRGSRDPDLLASLGLAEAEAGKPARALQFLESAAAGGTFRARAWAELARLRLDRALSDPRGPDGRLDGAQLQSVLQPLVHAHDLMPPLPEEYAIYRRALAHAPAGRNAAPTPPSK